jgi:hypothetical protein
MWHEDVRRRGLRWQYEVYNSAFGLVIGRCWRKKTAYRRIDEAIAEFIHD